MSFLYFENNYIDYKEILFYSNISSNPKQKFTILLKQKTKYIPTYCQRQIVCLEALQKKNLLVIFP